MSLTSLLAFFSAFALAALSVPGVIKLYRKRGWVDDPAVSKHAKKTHTRPLPRGGGVVIFIAILIATLVFLGIDKHLAGILLGALILAGVGILDDIYDIHPLLRILTGLTAALIVVGSGIGIAYVSNPFGEGVLHLNQPQLAFELLGKTRTIWILADVFALLFIVWNMNIVNWSKGVDGQMPGFVMIAAVFIGLLSQRFSDDPAQFSVQTLSFIVAGAYGGFLVWNFYPQKLMPGYGAGSLAGYFLSVLAILSGAKIATQLMVLAIPTADALFTIARRIIAGKAPWWGDRGHLHHKLMDVLGWGRRRIALFYWGSSLFMGIISLYLNTTGKIITMGVVVSLVFGFLIWAKLHQTNRQKAPR
jgi:UDP-GlcNAc:undecaprenyl-phosphate GlcNAc-1-phosphate transferase